jgi:hypothetical protein
MCAWQHAASRGTGVGSNCPPLCVCHAAYALQVGAEEREGLGSVAAYLSKNCKRPLVIVRPHLHAQ